MDIQTTLSRDLDISNIYKTSEYDQEMPHSQTNSLFFYLYPGLSLIIKNVIIRDNLS